MNTLKSRYVLDPEEATRLDNAVEEILTIASHQDVSLKRILHGAAWMITRATEGNIKEAEELAKEIIEELPYLVSSVT